MYEILRQGGMSEKVLSTYAKFLEDFEVRNTVVGGIGTPYKRPTGIPQRGPFSMMVTAMIMRPWLKQMEEAAVKPRILTDDLQILARGPNHLEHFEYAFDATHKHLYDMGAKIAPKKSVVFSSDRKSRGWLKQHRWGPLQQHEQKEVWRHPHGQDEEGSGCDKEARKDEDIIQEQGDDHQNQDDAKGSVWV